MRNVLYNDFLLQKDLTIRYFKAGAYGGEGIVKRFCTEIWQAKERTNTNEYFELSFNALRSNPEKSFHREY